MRTLPHHGEVNQFARESERGTSESTICANVAFGSKAEVKRGPRNVRLWGYSRHRFRAAGCLLVARFGHSACLGNGPLYGAEPILPAVNAGQPNLQYRRFFK